MESDYDNDIFDFENIFRDYKRSMIGKEDYIFLVNDASCEIRQHYDRSYAGITFDEKLFKNQVLQKKRYFEINNINYDFFVVPDKSIVLREYLPFNTVTPVRCVDKIKDCVFDLLEIMDVGDYQYDDTHVSEQSALKIVSTILNKLHPEFNRNEYEVMLNDKLSQEEYESVGDLLFPVNWTWTREHPIFKKYYASVKKRYVPKDINQVIEKELPQEFMMMGSRKTIYYQNNNSITRKKAIILRDSTTDKFIHVLSAYYHEVIFYWDHYYFDKDLIGWFNPDDVIEIKTERFIANPIKSSIDKKGNFTLLPENVQINKLELIKHNTLHLWVDLPVCRIIPFDAECEVMLNGNLLSTELLSRSSQNHIYYFLNNYPKSYLDKKLSLSIRIKRLIKRK